MKRILFVLCIVVSVQSFGQWVQFPTSAGIGYKRMGADTMLWIPADTLLPTNQLITRSHIAFKNGVLHRWNGTAWVTAGGSMTYPGAGLPLSSGSAWLTSISNSSTVGHVLRVTGASTYAFGSIQAGDLPATSPYTWQQTLTAGSTLTTTNNINLNGQFFSIGNGVGGVKPFVEIDLTPNLEYGQYGAYNTSTSNNATGLYSISNVDAQFVHEAVSQFGAVEIDGDVNVSTNKLAYIARRHVFTGDTIDLNLNTTSGKVFVRNTTPGSGSDSILVITSGDQVKAIAQSTVATAVPWSGVTASTENNTIANGAFTKTMTYNSLAGATALTLSSTSTAAASNSQRLFDVALSGANATSNQLTYATTLSNSHTGTSSTNIALNVSAAGGTNNYALIADAGFVGIGTTVPTSMLHTVWNTATSESVSTISSSSLISGTLLNLTGTSTTLAANNEGLNIGISGVNGTNAITATGARISVTNTNATSGTNVGLDLTASGATTANNALNIAAGAIALNGSAGTTGQVLTSAGANTLPTWTTAASGITVGTTTITSGTDTRVPFNDAGVYGEDAGLVYNKTTNALTVSDIVNIGLSGNYSTLGTLPLSIYSSTTGTYSKYISLRNDGITGDAVQRQLGIAFNMSTDAVGEIDKSASITLYTGSAWANDPTLYFNVGAIQPANMNSVTGFNTNVRTQLATTSGGVMIGSTSAATAKLDVLSTTEQLRLRYDASNYYSTTVGSTGGVTFDAVGAGAGFTFSDAITNTNAALTTPAFTGVPTGTVTSGTYTPTLTNGANVAASTAYSCQYMRVGNTVTVSGQVDVDVTLTATSTVLGISLPIASAIANANELGGTAFCPTVAGLGSALLGDATNDRATFQLISSDINNVSFYFTFQYRIL